MDGRVVAVCRSASHTFSKPVHHTITLLAGLGVDGDAHQGITVQHRSRVARDPTQPNLRQVHLMAAELFDDLAAAGHHVAPGDLGENITTRGLDLLALPTGTRLRIGPHAILEVTGLRNPCLQIDGFDAGLLARVVGRDGSGAIVRRAGIMSIVVDGGDVRPGDPVRVELPSHPYTPLAVV